jgi:hypothetical protein
MAIFSASVAVSHGTAEKVAGKSWANANYRSAEHLVVLSRQECRSCSASWAMLSLSEDTG